MSFQELAILLPCHSLEDFPQHHEGSDAEGLLASWTALWHPALLAGLERGPQWYRADDPPDEVGGKLVVVPSVSREELPADFLSRARSDAACLICDEVDRSRIIEVALASAGETPQIEPDLAADFLALGYCYLQMQLLTRQMRYSSNLDEGHFFKQLLAGAAAANEQDADSARAKLTACFDMLGEERDHYYSVDAYLIDVTIVDGRALGGLPSELAVQVPLNLLVSGEHLAELAESQPELLEQIRAAVETGQIGFVGGEDVEGMLPLLSCEMLLERMHRGAALYETHLGKRPEVYGRQKSGLSPLLPQVLDKLGYQGALHFTLDEGRLPPGSQAKTRWEGSDGTAIDAIAKPPLDAAQAGTFLGFAQILGDSMDSDHVATLCFVHWPGAASVWYDDLRRCTRYGAPLGRFTTVDEYFRETYMPGHVDRFDADRYSNPYLRRAVIRREENFLSRQIDRSAEQVQQEEAHGLQALASCLSGDTFSAEPESDRVQEVAQLVAKSLPRQAGDPTSGCLVLNPATNARRALVDVSQLASLPRVERPVYAAASDGEQKLAVVDVPGMGFTWIAPSVGTAAARKPGPSLVEDVSAQRDTLLLRNEYLEAYIDPRTGALKALKDYGSRGNRLSQQLAGRRRTPGQAPSYTSMVAESARVSVDNEIVGEIITEGKLLFDEELAGRFRQTFRVQRGSRVLQLDIQLESLTEAAADAWDNYFACRFAWADEAAQLYRCLHESRLATDAKRFESPHFVEIETGDQRTALLTGGLCFHRRTDYRALDTVLVVRGEQRREFRLGLAVDPPDSLDAARQLVSPPVVVTQEACPPHPHASGWLFHFDSKNIVATSWKPVVESGTIVGMRLRLRETQGRSARTRLSCFQDIRTARRYDFRGQSQGECRVENGRAHLQLTASEWTEFEVRWKEEAT